MKHTEKTMMQNLYIFFVNIDEKFYFNISLYEIYMIIWSENYRC